MHVIASPMPLSYEDVACLNIRRPGHSISDKIDTLRRSWTSLARRCSLRAVLFDLCKVTPDTLPSHQLMGSSARLCFSRGTTLCPGHDHEQIDLFRFDKCRPPSGSRRRSDGAANNGHHNNGFPRKRDHRRQCVQSIPSVGSGCTVGHVSDDFQSVSTCW